MGMGQTVLSNTAVQYSWAIQLGNRQPVATCNQLQLIAQLGSARPQCSPRHPLHKPLHPHTHMDLEGRRFESEVMRAFLPFTYVCNLSSSFCHQCVGTCMCALWKRIEVVHERGIDEEGGFAVRWQGLFSDMTVSTNYYPPPNPPNPETQIPRDEFKLNPNLNSNLNREVPKNPSFSIWWILGV